MLDTVTGVDSISHRVNLVSVGSAAVNYISVDIFAADSAEFQMLNNQRGYFPLDNFSMNGGESIWIDLQFKPDLTKPYPERYANRYARLVVRYVSYATGEFIDTTMDLIGTWTKNRVEEKPTSHFTINPNPVTGNSITLELESREGGASEVSIFDLLGKTLYTQKVSNSDKLLTIPVPQLVAGTYILRVSYEKSVNSARFEILR